MADIHLSNIKKSFGQTEILKGINLEIKDGEFMTLVGASGSGKSTLLRIISGLEEQSSGSIRIGGTDISDKRPKERDLAMVFQSYALYPHLTVRDNMRVPLRMRTPFWHRLPLATLLSQDSKATLREVDARVQEVAAQLHIEHLLDRKPNELSGGQCQRVALGRAMVREPSAFLMDEPLSNLDAKLRVHMRGELTQLHRELGTTFVYVTHDQVEAMTMSDRIALLVEGELIQVDTPNNMYNNPNHLKVAEFIGSPKINTIPALVDDEGSIIFDGQELSGIKLNATSCDAPITIAVRSEDLKIVEASNLSAVITHIENMGGEKIIFASAPWAKGSLAIKLTADESEGLVPGGNIHLQINVRKIMFFNRHGHRIQKIDVMMEAA
ncbi:ABC transporter ATP-binding protein [Vibrio comitans]|uniref:Glycerol-3-phosphate ABC transporter ATP-binding protein n=1 Tax=Vibrio comitans NBRC 102076 TaxID=1219078 RepID=A0A4Y3IJE5_9VIBR|nr:ABC transporter ATP-binding protein [Vibrio comitans]GEA59132.1 glycerol-3-phosphate ABC transporter ATP-binding protein [Vibrio comitans NBRC 102076]